MLLVLNILWALLGILIVVLLVSLVFASVHRLTVTKVHDRADELFSKIEVSLVERKEFSGQTMVILQILNELYRPVDLVLTKQNFVSGPYLYDAEVENGDYSLRLQPGIPLEVCIFAPKGLQRRLDLLQVILTVEEGKSPLQGRYTLQFQSASENDKTWTSLLEAPRGEVILKDIRSQYQNPSKKEAPVNRLSRSYLEEGLLEDGNEFEDDLDLVSDEDLMNPFESLGDTRDVWETAEDSSNQNKGQKAFE